jgi:Spy/CpxP family protein refolding chaperone
MSDEGAGGARGPRDAWSENASAGDTDSGRVVLSAGTARVLAIVVLFTFGLAGVAAGVALDRYVILPRRFGVRPPAEGPRGFFGPRSRQVIEERLNRYLELTPAQRTRFDSLMSREERELRTARVAAQPKLDSIVSETRREIDSILTSEQREKLHKLREEEGLGPGGRGFGRRDDPGAGAGERGRRGPSPYP